MLPYVIVFAEIGIALVNLGLALMIFLIILIVVIEVIISVTLFVVVSIKPSYVTLITVLMAGLGGVGGTVWTLLMIGFFVFLSTVTFTATLELLGVLRIKL